MMPVRTVSKKIGELLIERKAITPEQLALALEEQKQKGGYVSEHLIRMGFAGELDIAKCLSNQYNFAYLPVKDYTISRDLLELIPLKFIKIYTLFPVDKMDNTLSVAMADPLNEGVIQMLRQITNCEIVVFISTYSELNEVINREFGGKIKELEKYVIDPKDMEKIKTANTFVYTTSYLGPERRQYVRVKKELDSLFYYRGTALQAKTKDISYGGLSCISGDKDRAGVAFLSNVFIPVNTSLAAKIHLKPDSLPIDAVVNVLKAKPLEGETAGLLKYEISGMFEFIANEDRGILVSFLKENIP